MGQNGLRREEPGSLLNTDTMLLLAHAMYGAAVLRYADALSREAFPAEPTWQQACLVEDHYRCSTAQQNFTTADLGVMI